MMWLTIPYIKAHSRIEFDCENELLEAYGNAAEKAILNLLQRSYEDLMDTYGEVPEPVVIASLQLVDNAYTNGRSPSSLMNLSVVPYNFDLFVKPYMKL